VAKPLRKPWLRGKRSPNEELTRPYETVAALHQGAPGQITWLEDPPPWLKPWLALLIALFR